MSKKITNVICSIVVSGLMVIMLQQTSFAEEEIFLDLPIGLKIGESANINSSLIMTLMDVEDSRCPSDVTCVWEGIATAKIKLQKEDQDLGIYDIPMETIPVNEKTFEGYYITLTNVEPYPTSSSPIEDTNYSLTFFVSSAGVEQYVSPLKQYKNGVSFKDIKCRENLQLTQKYDGTPACVKPETVLELIARDWVSEIIKLVQSRDVSLDPDEPVSSYIDKTFPTLDDFKNTLSAPYDIDIIFQKFGPPHYDIGSGIHIYVYELNDSNQIWIGFTDQILYIRHVDSDGNLLEQLF